MSRVVDLGVKASGDILLRLKKINPWVKTLRLSGCRYLATMENSHDNNERLAHGICT